MSRNPLLLRVLLLVLISSCGQMKNTLWTSKLTRLEAKPAVGGTQLTFSVAGTLVSPRQRSCQMFSPHTERHKSLYENDRAKLWMWGESYHAGRELRLFHHS